MSNETAAGGAIAYQTIPTLQTTWTALDDLVIPPLLRVAKLHRLRRATALAEIGLHPGQDAVLLLLAQHERRTMGEMAAALAIQPPTVTKMVARLEAAGLVERHPVAGDQRKAAISLTPLGRGKVAQISAIWTATEATALAGLDGEARALLRRLLGLLEANLRLPRTDAA